VRRRGKKILVYRRIFMQDQILKSYLDDFTKEYSYEDKNEDERFERFVNYCIVSKQYPRDFDVESISVGGGSDSGLDGVAIIVNGNIIQNQEEIEFLINRNGYLNVSFLFIQTKNSPKFKGDQVGSLIFGLKSFFDKTPSIPENEEISNLRKTKDQVYKNTINLESAPLLDIYFVTTGQWKEPETITGRVERELKDFYDSRLFSSIKFNYIDADKLKETYREIRRKTIKEINFHNHVALPDIQGVRQSFIGSVSAKEFVKLIMDSDGELQKSLFEENVRDFQGRNKVNKDIDKTLKTPELQAALGILNNGITIIAKKVEPIGSKMKLTDFQIVNGCQTSHILYENKANLLENTHVVLKVIETTDIEISSKVIQATNKQTIVTDEAFESLTVFHKDLEEYYKARSGKMKHPIFYERRSKQYEGVPSVPAGQVMTLTAQIKAYVSTTLAQPHSTHRYYGELLESNRNKMFRADDKKESYFISCLALNRLERELRSGRLEPRFKPFKHHLLYIAHYYHELLRKNKAGYNYESIIDFYSEEKSYSKLFTVACKTIDECLKKANINKRDAVRSKEFTEAIRDNILASI